MPPESRQVFTSSGTVIFGEIKMLNIFYASLIYLTEMAIAWFFFSGIGEYRTSKSKTLLVGVILFEIEALLNVLGNNSVWINGIVMFTVLAVFSIYCFKLHFGPAVAYSLLLIALSGLMEFAVIFYISFISEGSTTDYNSDFSLLAIIAVLSKSLYFLICLLLLKFIKRKSGSYKYPVIFYIFAAGSVVSAMIFWYIGAHSNLDRMYILLLAAVSFLMFCFLFFFFISYQHSVVREVELARIAGENRALELEKSYYDIIEKQNQQLQLYIHDAKNHLSVIGNMTDDTQLKKYASELRNEYDKYSVPGHSGNKMLDVILNKYSVEAEMQDIVFRYDVKTYNLKNISDIHLVAVMNNLMDNAIAAAMDSSERTITLEAFESGNFGVVVIENSCDQSPKTKNGMLITTKEGTSMHGYGIKSAMQALKHYRGDLDWDYDEKLHRFIVTIMIPKI